MLASRARSRNFNRSAVRQSNTMFDYEWADRIRRSVDSLCGLDALYPRVATDRLWWRQ